MSTKALRTLNDSTRVSNYRPEIDGLRALAVIAVIVNHFNRDVLPSGYLGVDIFFVISGFVITSSLIGRPYPNLGDYIANFYVRRIKRLIPALLPFVVLTSLVLCFFNPGPGQSFKTGFSALFGVSNLYLLYESTDYFATAAEINVFTNTWSLGVEEQFYVLYPPLLWWAGVGRSNFVKPMKLMLVITALSVVSLVSFVCLYQAGQPSAYFSMPTRFWELAIGCLLFMGMREFGPIFRPLKIVPASLLAMMLLGALFIPDHFPVTATIVVVLITTALIARFSLPNGVPKPFIYRGVVYIGLISYSLYLWHWAVLSLSR